MSGVCQADIDNEKQAIDLFLDKGGHQHIVTILQHHWNESYHVYIIDMELCDWTLAEYIHYHSGGAGPPFPSSHPLWAGRWRRGR